MRNKLLQLFITSIASVTLAVTAGAGVPTLMSYQGVLLDSEGDPVTEPVNVTFTIYDSPSEPANVIWQETQQVEFDENGRFDVQLSGILDYYFNSPDRWLGVQLEGDAELMPRTRIVSVAYANRISTVDGAKGGTISGNIAIQNSDPEQGDISANGKATIGPGHSNTGLNAFVAGENNTANGGQSTIGGGLNNQAFGERSVISGGEGNTAGDFGATVGGGQNNNASNNFCTIGGGFENIASYGGSTVGGGNLNNAGAFYATIGGGQGNTTGDAHATIGGGHNNYASNSICTVGGGEGNTAGWGGSTVGGGYLNNAGAIFATVGGGHSDTAGGEYSTIGGGRENTAGGNHSAVGGGLHNLAGGLASTVAGGQEDTASGTYSNVAGGRANLSSGGGSSIAGGGYNVASGNWSAIPGGRYNLAQGINSFAAGRRAKANHDGSFVWGDNTDDDFASSGDGQFLIRASGGVGIGTTSPQGALDVSSTTGAFIVPRMTTTQRDNLVAVNGMIIYNNTTDEFNFYESGAWVTK